LYISCIYTAHYYELESAHKNDFSCDNGLNIYLQEQWFIIELRVFYGFILSGICFLMCSQLFGLDKSRRVNGVRIKGGSGGDFVEKYFPAKIEFCRKSFEVIMTLIIIAEYYLRTNSPEFYRGD